MACVVELFKIVSNTVYTLGERFFRMITRLCSSDWFFYEILKSKDDYSGVTARNRRRGFLGPLHGLCRNQLTGNYAFVIFKVDIGPRYLTVEKKRNGYKIIIHCEVSRGILPFKIC